MAVIAIVVVSLICTIGTAAAHVVPVPVAFWKLQEPAGQPKVDEIRGYKLVNGNESAPILRVSVVCVCVCVCVCV